jgi:prepilin-type processing-associated H-X9-DG protein
MNTNRQLVLAWRQYARDSGNQLPYAYAHIGTAAAPRAWIPGGGALDLDLSIPTQLGNWDADNTIKKSPLRPCCCKNADLWRCPADYHGQAAGFAFADGHAEIHKWKDPRTCPPLTTVLNVNVPQPTSKDVHWLQDHSSRVY